jgi:hypothetical protein
LCVTRRVIPCAKVEVRNALTNCSNVIFAFIRPLYAVGAENAN